MATDANMDWSHSTQDGYVPAFRSGNANQLSHPHDVNTTYMVHGQGSVHDPRSQYGSNTGYHSHDTHLATQLHAGMQAPASGMEEHFWPQQNDPSREDAFSNGASAPRGQTTPVEPAGEAHSILLDGEEPVHEGYTRAQLAAMPRSERRKLYKPKPEPANPRLFRPFQPLELADTTPTQWTMPPIVGSWLMFSNKMVKYRPMPPDIDAVREKLFKMESTILLKNSQEVADYVPHITNVWRRAVQRVEIDEDTGVQTEYWHCRTKKAQRLRKDDNTRKGIRHREKKSQVMFHDQEQCKMRIRVTSFTKHGDHTPFHLRVHGTRAANGHVDKGDAAEHNRWGGGPCKCVAEWVHFQRACVDPEFTKHTHDLEIMDVYKRSEALAVLAKSKVEEGNGYSCTAAWMQKTYGETSKQLSKFDKGDAANASQMWRNENKDLVLREEVPEDSEEMTTMRKCVDAILEADAASLRTALRHVLKDSHDLTKSALSILEKHNPTLSAPTGPEQLWRLSEGVTILDLPPPGPTERLMELVGLFGPIRTPSTPPQPASQSSRSGQGQHVPAPTVLGPDGRPISSVTTPGATAPLQGNARNGQPPPRANQQGHTPVNGPQARGAPLQPRPPGSEAYGAPHNVEARYVQAPPLPALPPQRGSVHPIRVSMEVPSCSLATCKQCKHMHRDLAGRTFFFQDSVHTPAQFSNISNLLRDPQQLLHDDYHRLLHKSQVVYAHPQLQPHPSMHPYLQPHQHPEPQGAQPQRPRQHDAPPLQRAPASAPGISQVQHLLPPLRHPLTPQTTAGSPSRSAEPEKDVAKSNDGVSIAVPSPSPAISSIYNQPLPVPIVIDDDDDDDAAAASDGDGDGNNNAGDATNGGNDSADKVNETGPEKHDNDQNATAVNETGAEKHGNDQNATAVNDDHDAEEENEEDDQRPAKRRRQESVAEE